MKIDVLKKEEQKVIFTIEGINPAVANMIRRFVINHVPTLAVEDVKIKENNSALYDELVAHRLGLVPLTTDLKSYTRKEDCKCEGKGCERCELVFTLKAKGPGTVYSSAIETKDPKVKPAIDNLPITKLLKEQELKIDGTIVLGRGKDHVKFSPGLVFYRGYPEIKTSSTSDAAKAVEECKGMLVKKGSKLEISDVSKWNEAYEDICERNGIEITPSKEQFIFTIEPWGQLSPKEMLIKAVAIFDDKLDEFEKLVSKIKEK